MHAIYSSRFRDITLYDENNEDKGNKKAFSLEQAKQEAKNWGLSSFDDDSGNTYQTGD